MKLNKNFIIKHVLDSDIIIDLKSNFDGVIKLNKTSKRIIEYIEQGLDRNEIINKLLDIYEVDKESLINDTNLFIDDLLDKGIIVDE